MIDLTASDRDRACTLLARLYQPRNKIYGKGVRVPRTFPADDLAWLEAVGLAPNQRKKLTHAAAVKAIVGARDAISIAEGARAFVATLGTGAPHGAFLELALMAHRMPSHRRSGGGGSCRVCMMDKEETVDRTEQFLDWHRSGSGIPGDPKWMLLALEAWREKPVKRASKDARARLALILRTLDDLPDGARFGQAVKAVRALDVLGDDPKNWRARGVLETLAFAGLLDSPPHRGVAEAWVDFTTRDDRPRKHVEVEAPLSFWSGKDGVHWGHAKAIFGMTEAKARKSPAPSKAKAPSPAKPAAKAKPAPKPKKAAKPKRLKRRPAEPGDVWGIRVREDTYVMVYVWEVKDEGRPYARVEYLDWIGETPPTDGLEQIGLRPRYDGPWQMRVHSLHKASGSLLVAEGSPAPKHAREEPDRVSAGAAKELSWLASSCFPEMSKL